MEIKLIVPTKIIAILKLFAATKDPRFYLNGINLEVGAKETLLVATDGHRLGCFRVKSEQPAVAAPLTDIIIPNELLKQLKPAKGGAVEITIGEKGTPGSSVRPITLSHAGMAMSGETIDGRFPDFRRVIPSTVTGEPAQFNPLYLGTLGKAYTLLHGNKPPLVGIGYNGAAAALIDLGDEDFVGVLMPLQGGRRPLAPSAPPIWWTDSPRSANDPA